MRKHRLNFVCRSCATSLAVLLLLGVLGLSNAAPEGDAIEVDPQRFAGPIEEFEKQDEEDPPPQGGILFTGSSSIRAWDVAAAFPDHPTLNRGFGGSHISDVLHFMDRIALPYQPETIVFYAGDNDVAGGKSPRRVLDDYTTFVERIHERLPETRVLFIAIKPSRARWHLWPTMAEANRLVREHSDTDPRLEYVDIASPMLEDDSPPPEALFLDDGLHLSAEGYEIWRQVLEPMLAPEKN